MPHDHRILLVEDDDALRDATTCFLRGEGFDVARAGGVEHAYRVVGEGFRPCIVLLDLHMPKLNGWAFVARLPTEPALYEVAIILVSADSTQHGEAERRGYLFLLKPTHPALLVAAIQGHCPRRS